MAHYRKKKRIRHTIAKKKTYKRLVPIPREYGAIFGGNSREKLVEIRFGKA